MFFFRLPTSYFAVIQHTFKKELKVSLRAVDERSRGPFMSFLYIGVHAPRAFQFVFSRLVLYKELMSLKKKKTGSCSENLRSFPPDLVLFVFSMT